jgi:hypothetical protein
MPGYFVGCNLGLPLPFNELARRYGAAGRKLCRDVRLFVGATPNSLASKRVLWWKPIMPNNLETMIQNLISEAAASMASQIAAAVRQSLAAEIMGSLASSGASSHGHMSAPSVKAAHAAPAKAQLAPIPAGRTRRSFVRRLITPGELAAVLDVVRRNPGFSSTQIQRELKIDGKEAGRLLGKLRQTKKVAWKGERAKATYTLA